MYRIPDAYFHIKSMAATPSWLTICLPIELENNKDSHRNEGKGQACAYLGALAKQRLIAREKEFIRGISIFTTLYVISFMWTAREPKLGEITEKMTVETPLFGVSDTTNPSPGFILLVSLLYAPLHLLVAPLADPPIEGCKALLYAANGTEIWQHPTEDAILKVALTEEKRVQLNVERQRLQQLGELGWRAESVSHVTE